MFSIWFERDLPDEHRHLIDGVAIALGPATVAPDEPFRDAATAQAIVAGGRLAYNADVMDRAPELKVIARTGIGVDNVDVEAATRRGIAVCNAPEAPTISTAEHAVALMMAVAKDLKGIERDVLRGDKADYFNANRGMELCDRQLGLIGVGRIGARVAALVQGLGMRVCAYDPFVDPARFRELNIQAMATIDELLAVADVVSLHLPLTDATRNLIDAQRLATMKHGAILINTSRGGIVDEAALVEALDAGRLFGAGIDAFVSEPPRPDHPLLNRADVVATPHIGTATAAAKARLWETAIEQAIQVLQGQRPPHLVNPDVWKTPAS